MRCHFTPCLAIFQSTLPVGGATGRSTPLASVYFRFQSTLPVGGATISAFLSFGRFSISIHTPRGGSDSGYCGTTYWYYYFNPHSPWGERPFAPLMPAYSALFQSTLPVGGATPHREQRLYHLSISIHTPRGGSDVCPCRKVPCPLYFNPHSPWGERRRSVADMQRAGLFQSTLPVGGATIYRGHAVMGGHYFNPHSPWGERPSRGYFKRYSWSFQSTLPVGGATISISTGGASYGISIHTPRGGSDLLQFGVLPILVYFNPHSPWGERQVNDRGASHLYAFQSTLPVGGATRYSWSPVGL